MDPSSVKPTVPSPARMRRSQSGPVRQAATLRRRTCLSIVFNDFLRVKSNS